MDKIYERHSIEKDRERFFDFPVIDHGFSQFLLIYEASTNLHDHNVKEKLVEFLLKEGATELATYVNTSIYFQLWDFSYEKFHSLNEALKSFVQKLEIDYDGRMFWILNQITSYSTTPMQIGACGKANESLDEEFQKLLEAKQKKL